MGSDENSCILADAGGKKNFARKKFSCPPHPSASLQMLFKIATILAILGGVCDASFIQKPGDPRTSYEIKGTLGQGRWGTASRTDREES